MNRPKQRSKQILTTSVVLGKPGWISHYINHENYFNKNNRLADERHLNPLLENKKDQQSSNQIRKLIVERLLLNISSDRLLNESLILMGGAALHYGYGFGPKTFDLDFTWKAEPQTDDKLRVISRLKDMAGENSEIFENKLEVKQKSPKKGDDELTFQNYVFSYLLEQQTDMEKYVQNGSNFKINFTIKQNHLTKNNQEDNSVIKVECAGVESLFEPQKLITNFGYILVQSIEDIFYSKLIAVTTRKKDNDKIHLKQLIEKRGKEFDMNLLEEKIKRRNENTTIKEVVEKTKEFF